MSQTATDVRGHVVAVDRRRRRHFIVGLMVLVLAVAVGTWWAQRPPTSPTVLGDRAAVGFDADPRPTRVAAGFAGIAFPGPGPEEVLTFQGTPTIHFRTNTAAATARVAVCVRAAGEGPVGVGHASDLATTCREVIDVKDGTNLRWIDRNVDQLEHLILVVTPSKAGVATVDQITYDYERESGERGLDVAHLTYTIRAT